MNKKLVDKLKRQSTWSSFGLLLGAVAPIAGAAAAPYIAAAIGVCAAIKQFLPEDSTSTKTGE